MPAADLVVKWGGSAVTNKAGVEELRADVLAAAAARLAAAVARGERVVLVHGAGSFGHGQARRHGLHLGKMSAAGVSETRASVLRLHALVCTALADAGVAVASLSPFPAWSRDVHQPRLAACLAAGLVPVLHGDVVLSADGSSCSILSGDRLVEDVAAWFDVPRVAFLSDVAGCFSRPPPPNVGPAYVEGLVRRVSPATLLETSQAGYDVTGGIRAKIDAALRVAKRTGHAVAIAHIAGSWWDAAEGDWTVVEPA